MVPARIARMAFTRGRVGTEGVFCMVEGGGEDSGPCGGEERGVGREEGGGREATDCSADRRYSFSAAEGSIDCSVSSGLTRDAT